MNSNTEHLPNVRAVHTINRSKLENPSALKIATSLEYKSIFLRGTQTKKATL